jgi:hypothetical protein
MLYTGMKLGVTFKLLTKEGLNWKLSEYVKGAAEFEKVL